MSFIQRELDRVSAALTQTENGPRYDQLYAAQQALAWTLEPTGIKSPLRMITGASDELDAGIAELVPSPIQPNG